MAIIFDGKTFALQKKEVLKKKVLDLNTKGKFPHLASIVIGDNPASKLYVSLKKKAGEKIGIQVDIYNIPEKTPIFDILKLIDSLNNDKNIHGIMIQLPLPDSLSEYKEKLINAINDEKDVDGLKDDSLYIHPTSLAVLDILNEAQRRLDLVNSNLEVAVVGSTGMVGKPLVRQLKKNGYKVLEFDSKNNDLQDELTTADVVISATGVSGIIKASMLKKDVIVIDVGSPQPDFEKDTQFISSFFTPVPGGVGPVTISCLFENLTKASKKYI